MRALLLLCLVACGSSQMAEAERYGAELQVCARLPAPQNDQCACKVSASFGRSCSFLDGGRDGQ